MACVGYLPWDVIEFKAVDECEYDQFGLGYMCDSSTFIVGIHRHSALFEVRLDSVHVESYSNGFVLGDKDSRKGTDRLLIFRRHNF